MAIPEVSISASLLTAQNQALNQLVYATRSASVSTLAAAIIAARGKPISIGEVMEIHRSIWFAMFPEAGSGAWQDWAKAQEQHLAKIYD